MLIVSTIEKNKITINIDTMVHDFTKDQKITSLIVGACTEDMKRSFLSVYGVNFDDPNRKEPVGLMNEDGSFNPISGSEDEITD